MSATLKPYGCRILARITEPETQTATGIIIPESARKPTGEYEIVAVGNGEWDRERGGMLTIRDLKVGMKIVAAKYTGAHVSWVGDGGEDEYGVILKPEEILAVVCGG